MTGRIIKAVGGNFDVTTGEEVYSCRARGLFRKEGRTPLVGDMVIIEPLEHGQGIINEIMPRKNSLVRPPLANLDRLFLVSSADDPKPNLRVLDRLIAIAEDKEIEPVIVFTKADLKKPDDWTSLYKQAGFLTFQTGIETTEEELAPLREAMKGKLSAFCGNTGVGKSSLLNKLDSRLDIVTGQTSKKLGRGRHTTREVRLYPVEGGGFIADTPGFSSVDLEQYGLIYKENLQYCFREFAPFLGECQFRDCSHTKEKGCAVLQAVRKGQIAPTRHESYIELYENAKNTNEWEMPQQKGRG